MTQKHGQGRPGMDFTVTPEGDNMTDKASRSAAQGGKSARAGLQMRRIHTRDGIHPYDEVTWERRDVVMTNWRDGSVNFEQHGVEFPDFWSVNAANIVTTKYFRGAVGGPQRERSLKQLIDRVVGTYGEAGRKHGYFAGEADAQIFEHELTYALLHQIFAFNSPVWFNVGTSSPQQVSACQPYGALVSTPAGLVPIGKLVDDEAVGTKVFDASGVTRIVATKANGVKDVLRLHTKAGYTLDVTDDHLVWRSTGTDSGSFVPAGMLKVGDQLEWHRREAFGEAEIDPQQIAQAALAGWLQSAGGEVDGDAEVPAGLFDAPLPVVASYLRSVFQAEGFVSARAASTVVEVDMISEHLIRGMQQLLLRFGIYARVGFKNDPRPDRHGCWTLRIQTAGDRRIFADEIGFIDPVKAAKLERSFDLPGQPARQVERLEIARVERLGAMDVYDIQTESGEYLSGNLRVHNCFILAVDDTMESILDWYREEGLIFKGGSGAGVNLSRIRSSSELLASGGTASGPVSFMRGADASAGTIKSGGATRRAAKMVVLDVDHPDVEEFIETKAREEEKIRVLRDGGFDMDLGGKDIASVQYQNANNSVRVTDDFMRAVESGSTFNLLARQTGETVKQVQAKDLFRQMAKAAWECADPGIQYDDTINDWHTCPESGRITASNPCFPADQRVVTDMGLIRIGDLVARAAAGESFAVYTDDITSQVDPADRLVPSSPTRYLVTGTNEIVELRFSDGSRLRCTPGHRIWTANRGWVHAEELTSADRVVRSIKYAARSSADARIPASALTAAASVRSRKALDLPEKWDSELGHYLGWLVADGCVTDQNVVTVYGSDDDHGQVLPRHRELLASITGFDAKPSIQANGTQQLRVTRNAFIAFTRALGVSSGRAAGKQVPGAIFEAPQDALRGFLQGLFDADGCVVNQENGTRYVGLGSRSEELLIGVQELLGSLGIASRIYRTGTKTDSFSYTRKDGSQASDGSDGPSFDLRITGRSLREFGATIGFSLPAKHRKLFTIIGTTTWYNTDETVRVVSARSQGFETTYNLTEPRNHSYIVGGTVVANCSEYVHLDNSSCNLASINLLKFLRADDTFEVERFRQITELIITAMDISICFADFPTEKITATTRAYRQLGIGYANLGALLMATGHAYDSDDGRAIAGAITSLMTGTAYRRSAELAAVVGPYDGYARNATAHKRVIAKHAAASKAIRPLGGIDDAILAAANNEWQQCLTLGEANGYRNAQSSLLAPTGTIGLMMDCDTTGVEPDLALVKFKKLVGGGSMQIVNQTVPRALKNLGYQPEQAEAIVEYIAEHGHVVDAPGLRPEHYEVFDCAMGERSISAMGHVRMMAAVQPALSGAISKCVTGETLVASSEGLVRIASLHQGESEDTFRPERLVISSLDGDRKTDAFYYGGVRPVRRVRLRSGHQITGTLPHRLLVAGEGRLDWKTLGEIEAGDSVAVQYGAELWAANPADLGGIVVSPPHGNQKQIVLPQEMTSELAFLLGAYAAEGHTTRSTWTIVITNSVPEVLERVRQAWESVFGLHARITADPGKCTGVVVSSKDVVEFMSALGCGSRSSDKRIPDAVLRSPREMVLAFLQGLALDAYVTTTTAPKWAICLDSPRLLDDLQAVLTNLDVMTGRVAKYNKEYDKYYDEVYAAGTQGQLMVSLVPFLEPDKAARAADYLQMSFKSGTADVVPGVTGRELYNLIPPRRRGDDARSWRSEFTFLLDHRTKQVTRTTLERVSTLPGVELPAWLLQVIRGNLHFSPVESVVDAGQAEVYDLSVPTTHAFVANGIVNHNTVNLPESATVADIEKIYFEGWKLGLKALAIYRDNCKVGQPLSASKSKPAETTATVVPVAPRDVRPVRRRLPRQRSATVTRFSVAGSEGYMTASTYADDGVGEVFLKLGKQGSTLAGVMDAFSIAISVGLQYGIPLESYVAKFTNMRFEPAGITDDPDIRMVSSVMDYIFRRLALDYLPYDQRADLGILSVTERTAALTGEDPAAVTDEVDPVELAQSAPVERAKPSRQPADKPQPERTAPDHPPVPPRSSTELIESHQGRIADAPLCLTCGTKMRPAGSCYVCEGCGSTSGCS
jgi:ribonucleotide reductase alpha subunit